MSTCDSFEWRREQLTRLRTLLDRHREELADAVFADLRRSRADAHAAEIDACVDEIDRLLGQLVGFRPQSACSLDDVSRWPGLTWLGWIALEWVVVVSRFGGWCSDGW